MIGTVDFTIQTWHICLTAAGVVSFILLGIMRKKFVTWKRVSAEKIAAYQSQRQLERKQREEREEAAVQQATEQKKLAQRQREEQQKKELGLWSDVFEDFRAIKSHSARMSYLRSVVSQLDFLDPNCRTLSSTGLNHFAMKTGEKSTAGLEWRREVTGLLEPYIHVDVSALIASEPIPDVPLQGCHCKYCNEIRWKIERKNKPGRRWWSSTSDDTEPAYVRTLDDDGLSGCHCKFCDEIRQTIAKTIEREEEPAGDTNERIARKGEPIRCGACNRALLRGEGDLCSHCESDEDKSAPFVERQAGCSGLGEQGSRSSKPRQTVPVEHSNPYEIEPWWQALWERLVNLDGDAARQAVLYAVLKTIQNRSVVPMSAETYQKFIDLFGVGYKTVPETNLRQFVTDEKTKVEPARAKTA